MALTAFMAVFIFSECTHSKVAHRENDKMFQYSTINALLDGVYEGNMTFG